MTGPIKNTSDGEIYLTDPAFLKRQLHAIAELAESFLTGQEPDQRYDMLSGVITDVLQLEGCLVLEKLQQKDRYHLYSACGFCDLSHLESTNWLENDQFRDTMETDEVISAESYGEQNGYVPPDRDCFRTFRSGMSVRIPGGNDPKGLIAVYHLNPRRYNEHEAAFLRTVANMLSGVLSREANERDLRESEARNRAVLDTAVDGIVTIDRHGHITLINKAAQKIFGYKDKEVLGQNISMLMPEPYRKEHDSYLQQYRSTGQKKIIGSGREMTGRRRDGSTFPLYLAVSEFYIGEELHLTGIVRDISEQRRLEQEVLNIGDHERRRIGQDLHDGLGQMLTGIGLMSQSLQKMLKNEDSTAAKQAGEITRHIKKADEYARTLSRGLIPVDFEVRGLVRSLERLAANAERLFGITCTFLENNQPVFQDASVVEHLYRIAQEAISNAVKHGMASEVRLDLSANESYARLRVVDNGRGFPTNWEDRKGSGMDIMQFRAQLIGATLEIRNRDDAGAEVLCVIPVSEASYRIEAD